MRRGLTVVLAAGCAALLTSSSSLATAATHQVRYTPFNPDGSVRENLRVRLGEVGDCRSGSFIVVGAYRCFGGNSIYDVCDREDRAGPLPSLLCVGSPWARQVVRLRYITQPDEYGGARPGGPPWAVELASRRRCVWVGGATTVVGGFRLNYACGRYGRRSTRYLFGGPDRSQATWRIRQATTPNGRGLRKVAIRTAWR